ncbi:proteasome assembly chaperone family protein [Halorubrum ezzemoulense]|uniref:Proteasome assembly chaperone family protein n=2 Tax=Halorubrum ezzemoulense TaxID=337243 RepID=A0A256IKR9_HALEZ|nr:MULTISPECIES: proteasome assembly chaperone family protein [Halorubrum]MDB2225456.1 proteasome assembly chaperone family protein [Halorubrum ezzemoulense]MDB2237117.1 proteasome assembly chaperone family protein [Halorubrum ezzemoulense]MDB2241595.1 proteasome assembly chaperone family protein [Halorubrum ezzemoulense]MDB2245585.1 proteasome assembly chaperone family protein [Halorubrum ezzemoulense]MDB2246933.1 proteasome assembly chaperone family protein [Halorubrum ezzemoulense]
MEDIEIDEVATPELDDPVLIEGLPGVGHVGKLAAEHILEEFDGELVRRVYATEFPPQVSVDDEGVAELTCAEFHAVETDGADLLVLTGDHQAGSNAGHYRLTSTFLDVAAEFGAERAFALGGVPTGELVEEYTVLGAVSDGDLTADLEDAGVEFRADEPAGGIVGVSGLVLGLGGRRGFDATCLMGETSGYLVDPKSARAVLEVLEAVLDLRVDYESLEDRAEEMEEVVGKIREMQEGPAVPDDDLRYIG